MVLVTVRKMNAEQGSKPEHKGNVSFNVFKTKTLGKLAIEFLEIAALTAG